MRISLISFAIAVCVLSFGIQVDAQTNTFTKNLSLGSQHVQVTALQKVLNQDQDTRVAATGPGSAGNETDYFGLLTKAAVIRFQEKYANDILIPAGLAQGNGYVGSYTRAKLNVLPVLTTSATNTTSSVATTAAVSAATSTQTKIPSTDYLVKDSEKIDIYVGDKMLANVKSRIYAAVNAGVASRVASRATATSTEPIVLPSIGSGDVPSIAIGVPSPRLGAPGSYVSLKGVGITANSVLYFGKNYIVRKTSGSPGGVFIFVVPPIPPGHYDIAVKTGGTVSNTTAFVVRDPKSPPVHIQSVSPAAVRYGGTLTITGSGFTPINNIVVTTQQKFTGVPSTDGTTLTITLTPEVLSEYAKVSNGTMPIPMSVSVENDYGFSDSTKSFTMAI
ncbi:MAG: peptidoglycan-binding domain-containing protein [bacterium]|nr:peptidoglycan-binding domain-containing protein [bacterium]